MTAIDLQNHFGPPTILEHTGQLIHDSTICQISENNPPLFELKNLHIFSPSAPSNLHYMNCYPINHGFQHGILCCYNKSALYTNNILHMKNNLSMFFPYGSNLPKEKGRENMLLFQLVSPIHPFKLKKKFYDWV